MNKKRHFKIHSGDECNQPATEVERVRVLGKGVAVVRTGGSHQPGTVKMARFRRGEDGRSRAYFMYAPSVSLAWATSLRHVVERMLDGSGLVAWADPRVQVGFRANRSIALDERMLRLRTNFVLGVAKDARAMRRTAIKVVARRHNVRQKEVRTAIVLPWLELNDLLQEVDAQGYRLEHVIQTLAELLSVQHEEAGIERLPLSPDRERAAQEINDLIASLERIDDLVTGGLARQCREALRTAHHALWGVEIEPYRASLTEAMDRALVALTLIKADLVGVLMWMGYTVGHSLPVSERAMLVNSIAMTAGALSPATWSRHVSDPRSPLWTSRLLDACLRSSSAGEAERLQHLERKLRELRSAFMECRARPVLVKVQG